MIFLIKRASWIVRSTMVPVIAAVLAGCAGNPGTANVARQEQIAVDPAAMMRIATAAENSGDLGSAETFYRRAADLRPGLVAAQIGDARTLAQQGNIDQALEVLRAAHIRNADDTEIAETLGRLLVVDKKAAQALVVFQDGLVANPRSAGLLVGQGVALDLLNRHAEAQSAYHAALLIEPDSAPARRNLALSQKLASEPAASTKTVAAPPGPAPTERKGP